MQCIKLLNLILLIMISSQINVFAAMKTVEEQKPFKHAICNIELIKPTVFDAAEVDINDVKKAMFGQEVFPISTVKFA